MGPFCSRTYDLLQLTEKAGTRAGFVVQANNLSRAADHVVQAWHPQTLTSVRFDLKSRTQRCSSASLCASRVGGGDLESRMLQGRRAPHSQQGAVSHVPGSSRFGETRPGFLAHAQELYAFCCLLLRPLSRELSVSMGKREHSRSSRT